MQHTELAALAQIPIDTVERYEAIGLWKSAAPDRLVRLQQIFVLEALGFSIEQITRVLQAGVSSEQLRGMLRYRQTVDPMWDCVELVARIDRIEELSKLTLDSHPA